MRGLIMSTFWAANRAMDRASSEMLSADARAKATDARRQVADLSARLDRAMLVCEALWTVVRDRVGVTEEELIARVNEVDLSDGQLDGKVRRSAVACPRCKRTIARRFKKCVYCGQPIMQDPFA